MGEKRAVAMANFSGQLVWYARRTAVIVSLIAATIASRFSARTASSWPNVARVELATVNSTSRGGSPSTTTATSGSPIGRIHRVQKLSPQGKFLMKIGEYGALPAPQDAYGVTYLGPYISTSGTPGYVKAGLSITPRRRGTDGDISVADWGNHRVCVFDSGQPDCELLGDAQVMSKWGSRASMPTPT